MPFSIESSESRRFPILKLLPNVQWEIIRKADIADVIVLTYSSSKMRNLVIEAGIQNAEVYCEIGKKDEWILEVDGKFTIKVKEVNARKSVNSSINRRKRQVVLKFKNCRRQIVLVQNQKSVNSLNHLLLEHLMPVFRTVNDFDLKFDLGKEELGSHAIWNYRRSMTSFLLESSVKRHLSRDEMNFIFEQLTIERNLQICPFVHDDFIWMEGFTQETVVVNNPTWVDFSAIHYSESRRIHLYWVTKPSSSYLNDFLNEWISHENMSNLESFQIKEPKETFFLEDLAGALEGIEYEKISENEVTIQRVDGKKAMVTMIEKEFRFVVLHE